MYKIGVFLALCSVTIKGDNPSLCKLFEEGGEEVSFDTNVFKNSEIIEDVGSLTKKFTYEGELSLPTPTNDMFLQATVVPTTKELIFETTKDFTKLIDAETAKDSKTLSISLAITLKCVTEQTTPLTFIQDVTDTNNNAPTFKDPSSSYVYTIAQPMPPKYDITQFGTAIVAKDIDFSNTNIEFTVNPDIFKISTEIVKNSKLYIAHIVPKKYTSIHEDTEFTITATDNGEPTKSTDIIFKIIVDTENSIPDPDLPTFKEPSYKFQYSMESGKPRVTPTFLSLQK